MSYAAIAAKEVRPPTRAISPEGDKEKETASAVKSLTLLEEVPEGPSEEKVKKYAICVLPRDNETTDRGGAQGPIRFEGRHEGDEGFLVRRKTDMRYVDNASMRTYPDKEDRD